MPRTTHTDWTANDASDARAVSPYAARLEAWLSAHLETTWPPVDADLAAAKVRALTDTPGVLR